MMVDRLVHDDRRQTKEQNHKNEETNPLTLLRSRTMFGRPDWKSIYGRMREAIETGQYLPGSNSQLRTKVGVSLPN